LKFAHKTSENTIAIIFQDILELKVVDLTFFILFYFLFLFILNLGLGFSMTLYVTVTSHGHIIICHTEERRF